MLENPILNVSMIDLDFWTITVLSSFTVYHLYFIGLALLQQKSTKLWVLIPWISISGFLCLTIFFHAPKKDWTPLEAVLMFGISQTGVTFLFHKMLKVLKEEEKSPEPQTFEVIRLMKRKEAKATRKKG